MDRAHPVLHHRRHFRRFQSARLLVQIGVLFAQLSAKFSNFDFRFLKPKSCPTSFSLTNRYSLISQILKEDIRREVESVKNVIKEERERKQEMANRMKTVAQRNPKRELGLKT